MLFLRIYIRYFIDTENYIAVKKYETYIFPVLNIALKGEKACDEKRYLCTYSKASQLTFPILCGRRYAKLRRLQP